MSLEDFHNKALRLVKEAEYPEGDTWNRVLRDIIISGLASDKIQAKIIKEGKDVTLARVMEIAQLEVSTQRHIDRMQEIAKVNYVHYGKDPRKKRSNQDPVAAVVAVVAVVAAELILETLENLMERAGKFHYPLMSVGDVEKGGTKKDNLVKLWKQFAETVEQRVTMRKCV